MRDNLFLILSALAFALGILLIGILFWSYADNVALKDGVNVIKWFDNSSKLLASLGVLIASGLASLSVHRTISNTTKIEEERANEKKSEFIMKECIYGLESVFDLLKNKNNNRAIWIHSARMLQSILEQEKLITYKAHINAYDIRKRLIQTELACVLTITKELDSLPTSFFFGIEEWETITRAQEAYNISEEGACISYTSSTYDVDPSPPLKRLHLHSVATIFDFITSINFEDLKHYSTWEPTSQVAEGAKKYFAFMTQERTSE